MLSAATAFFRIDQWSGRCVGAKRDVHAELMRSPCVLVPEKIVMAGWQQQIVLSARSDWADRYAKMRRVPFIFGSFSLLAALQAKVSERVLPA